MGLRRRFGMPGIVVVAPLAVLAWASSALAAVQASNLAESNTVNFSAAPPPGFATASSFTTGAASSTLENVAVSFHCNTSCTVQVRLRADSGGAPGALLENLGAAVLPGGASLQTFNSVGTMLAAGTTYWVTAGESGTGNPSWRGTFSTTDVSSPGWSIGDQAYSTNDGGTWNAISAGPPNETGLFSVSAGDPPPPPSFSDVIPYEAVHVSEPTTPGVSSNNVYDIDLTMCLGPSAQCIDRTFTICSASGECEVRPVPTGRCAAGNSASCNWNVPTNTAAHRCDVDTWIQCASAADCPSGQTCSTALGATPAQVAACACAPGTADPVCGSDGQARCSDGDESIAFGGATWMSLCSHTILSPISSPGGCGFEGGQALTGPRNDTFENAPSTVTPQRRPGTGSSPQGDVYPVRNTYGLVFSDPDPTWGVRRLESIGRSQWMDATFTDTALLGSGVQSTTLVTAFRAPDGWDTGASLGTCSGLVLPGALCRVNSDCSSQANGTCGALGPAWALATDEIGFVFTQDVDPNLAPATCPPLCGLDYDFHTFEQRTLEGVGRQDSAAGVQLALDSLSSNAVGRYNAGEGDVISVARWTINRRLTDDARCRIGGDPDRANPLDSKIGICVGPASPGVVCDPATEDLGGGTNDCAGTDVCRWCNTPADAAVPYLPDGYDAQAGNCEPGFDCSALDVNGRMGVATGIGFDLVVPITVVWTSGLARAEVRDPTCTPISSLTSCALGAVGTGTIAHGIGSGGTFANGFAFPAFATQFGGAGEACCATGSSITWAARDDGSLSSPAPVGTGDWLPGPNRIPGCIGDSNGTWAGGTNFPACAGPLGLAPGTSNPGSDDVPAHSVDIDTDDPNTFLRNASDPPRVGAPGTGPSQAVPNPLAGAPAAGGLPGALDDPNGAPTLRSAGAGSAIDLYVLGLSNSDWLYKLQRVWCPVRDFGPDCWYDADADDIDDDFDNCLGLANASQADTDGDGVGDACDRCVTVPNVSAADTDGDGTVDDFDNCVCLDNPPVSPIGFQTTTGGQLDDDADGYGNRCDGDYNNVGAAVDSTDLSLFKAAFGKKRASSLCNPGGSSPCDRYDHTNSVATIDGTDFTIFKALIGKTKKSDGDLMDRCPTCPLAPCVGDACP